MSQACAEFLQEAEAQSKADLEVEHATNGREGTISNKTKTAVQLLLRSLNRLKGLAQNWDLRVDCRALATLYNEHFHAHMRDEVLMSDVVQFCRALPAV